MLVTKENIKKVLGDRILKREKIVGHFSQETRCQTRANALLDSMIRKGIVTKGELIHTELVDGVPVERTIHGLCLSHKQ